MISISTIKSRYYKAAKKIPCFSGQAGFQTRPHHDGTAHVEAEDGGYSSVVTERGQTYEVRRTDDPDELLYWLVRDLTFGLACDFEVAHRREGEDSRRQFFAKQIEYMEAISQDWAKQLTDEKKAILEEHPYNDEGR